MVDAFACALGGVGFRLCSDSQRVIAAARAHFAGFEATVVDWEVELVETDPRALLDGVIPGELAVEISGRNVRARVGALPDFFPPGSVQNLLRVLLVHDLVSKGGLLLHASSAEGRVFFGRSGAGKSTLARGFKEGTLLSDEIAVIDSEGRAHRAPFTGERLPPPRPLVTPVRALYAIDRGATFATAQLSQAEALRRVMTCVVNIGFDRDRSTRLFDNAASLCARVPVFAATLPRLPDDEAAARALFQSWFT